MNLVKFFKSIRVKEECDFCGGKFYRVGMEFAQQCQNCSGYTGFCRGCWEGRKGLAAIWNKAA